MEKLSDIVAVEQTELGHGWSARVFPGRLLRNAFKLKANSKVAVKVFRPEIFVDPDKHIRQRIERELQWGQSNVSDRVVRSYGLLEAEDKGVRTFALIMEFVNGHQLSKHIEQNFPLSANRLLRITNDLFEGLKALHSSGLVHRDIKPENIMVEHNGHAKLMDLGVIKVPLQRRHTRLTASAEFLGTIRYADPEYLFDGRDDELADSWSLGLTLFLMLYGQPPYAGKQRFAQLVVAVEKGKPGFPKGVDRFATTLTRDHLFIESVMMALVRPRPRRLTATKLTVNTIKKRRGELSYYIEHLQDLGTVALTEMASNSPVFVPWIVYKLKNQFGVHALEEVASAAFIDHGQWILSELNINRLALRGIRGLLARSLPYPDELKTLPKEDKLELASQLRDYFKRSRGTHGGAIHPAFYFEQLASEESDDEVRKRLLELTEIRGWRKRY